ncbi:sigma 54-interacting transcriptional regulator [Clostridium sp. AM58-1XD]|uniref:sigma 54-interacting transcriptional regulator n=1 Tax=Clostridium sp. AM58-1XD TaxID=2292307 RepID=UPI001FA8CF53|nr:sigma 54-interacting transcriptional regulator [Clostridium sp. AM58-1XD]
MQISIPTADILRTIRNCSHLYRPKKIGIIAAGNMIAGITGLADLSDAPINTYILSSTWNNQALVDQAVSENCDVILGGINTCRYAEMIHIPNMVIRTSKEAFWDAISTAKRTAAVSRREQEKTLRLHTLLDMSHDGIIFIDSSRRITSTNKKAQSILNIDDSYLGKRIIDFPFPLDFKNILSDNREYTNDLIQFDRVLLNISKTFVKTQDFISGSIVNIQMVNEIQSLEGDIRKRIYEKGHVARLTFDDMIGSSPVMCSTIKTAKKYGSTNSNILLIGESGTGKEIFAQSIHNASPRKSAPFVAVNCAAIPDNLLESELFGYAPGSFTGAQKNGKAGLFELAHKGTIFLDEIGEIPLPLQAKLLRVLQEREIMRVGGDSVIHVDIRIIAATNQNLESLVKEKKFREDLFYRLDVLRINLPPLNRRREDIPLLVEDFMKRNFPQTHILPEVMDHLCRRDWPGNVRQLFNICERLAVLCSGHSIDSSCLSLVFPESEAPEDTPFASELPPSSQHSDEYPMLLEALSSCRYNKGKTAQMLGISRSTLWRKLKENGIQI